MQITEDNIPLCDKCKERRAMMSIDRLWVCGECYHKYIIKLQEERGKAFLEG